MKQSLFKVFFVVGILLLAFSNCDFSLNRSRQYSIVSPDELSQIPADDFFYINIKSAFYTGEGFDPLDFVFYAREEGPGADCKVRFTEENSSTEDLFCMLEVSEGDLYLHDINIEYNVPPGMCHYLSFRPHWHYNQKTGVGPKYVAQYKTRRRDENGSIILNYIGCKVKPEDETTPGSCSNSNCSSEEACKNSDHDCNDGEDQAGQWTSESAISICPKNQQIGYNNEEHSQVCQYKRKIGDKDTNCCLGKYDLYEDGGLKEEEQPWGGDGSIKECIGGLARLNWNAFDDNGFPIPLVAPSGSSGVRETYELPNLLSKNKTRHSFPTANFYDKIGEDDEPTFPPEYRNRSKLTEFYPKSYPYITWSCLDQNYEVRHQIHLIIREWNTQEEFLNFKESNGSSGDPDTGGDEGNGCDYYTANNNARYFGKCNDLYDLDDQDKGRCSNPKCQNKRDCENTEHDCNDNDRDDNNEVGRWLEYPELPYQGAGGGGSSR